MKQKLTPSERLIINVIRSSSAPVHAGTVLAETAVSIHTLGDALLRLTRLGLIVKVDVGGGPHYAAVIEETL